MINMQSAFLIVSKGYSEKQAGLLFFTFGMSQFLCQTPAGYLFDYTQRKVAWLSTAGVLTTLLTLLTALFATDQGGNLWLMLVLKTLQGGVTSCIPPGLNSITQGIVGGSRMTGQVAQNEMMNHLGTALIVLSGSLLGYWLYPDHLGYLFVVSPIACAGFLVSLLGIPRNAIDHAAARGMKTSTNEPTTVAEEDLPTSPAAANANAAAEPSFAFYSTATSKVDSSKPDSPWRVVRDPVLLTFLVIVFLFHTANGTVLPLVMQTLALGSGRAGILLSGLCIIVAQLCMVASAHVCGTRSGVLGRKPLFLIGLLSVPVRCLLLYGLVTVRAAQPDTMLWPVLILATQILDGVGAGVFGTMYILVTSDIAGGTGRFSFMLGLTTAAMSIGGTVSGYLGQALAQDLGYRTAFLILAGLSLVPAVVYGVGMPETLSVVVDSSAATNETKSTTKIDSIPEEESATPYGRLA